MKTLTIILLICISLILIIIGCGGNDGVSQPSSVSNPSSVQSEQGYLTIKVIWPQSGASGNCITSSGDNKYLTASIPEDTQYIKIKIYDFVDPNTPLPNGYTEFSRGTEPEEKQTLGPIPAIKVKIRAEAYSTQKPEPISVAEQELQIKPGTTDNTVNLNLGDYSIGLKQITPDSSVDTSDANIETTLSIVYPTPAGTPATPLGGRTIKFDVINVTYKGSNPPPIPVDLNTVLVDQSVKLDDTGYGIAKVSASIKPVTATIKATLVGLDGQDTIISKTCDVDLLERGYNFWTCLYPFVLAPGEKVVRKYDQNGVQQAAFGERGTGNSQFYSPYGMDRDSLGNFYIADSYNKSIKKFDSNGNFINKWGDFDAWDVCVDSKDNVYVCVRDDNEIQKFDSNGNLLTRWGSNLLYGQCGIDCDSERLFKITDKTIENLQTQFSPERLVNLNQLLNKALPEEKLKSELINLNFNNGEIDTIFNNMDIGNCIYVADLWHHRIVKFDWDGILITTWDSNGTGDGQFNQPRGIIVDKIYKFVYVQDFLFNNIQKFDLDGNFLLKFATDIRSCTRLGVDPSGYVYANTYTSLNQPVIRKYSPENGTFIKEFPIDSASKIIFVSK